MLVLRLMKIYEQGILECWNNGIKNNDKNLSDPIFHHSIVPLIFD